MATRTPRRIALELRGLSGRTDILRFDGARQRDPAIDVWLQGDPVALRAIARHWFARMRHCGADVCELMHDGCPVACVADAPFGYVNTFTSHVNVGFYHGNALADPAGLLQGSGKRMRHVKLQPAAPANVAALDALIGAAYADIKARLAAAGPAEQG